MSREFVSLFSGIEAASVAWTPLGWKCKAVSEIKPAACRILAHHYPDVPNLGDVTKITEEDIALLGPINLIVFGSPCQDLSLAGKRKGFAGERSGLFHTANRIVGWAREHCGLRYALWENVYGAFSSNKGRDFAAVVGALAGCEDPEPPKHGWGTEGVALGGLGMVEWGVLDAQWFGVPQRRRRVFALADFGDWAGRSPVLLERESLRGDHPPRRSQGEEIAIAVVPSLKASGLGSSSRIGDTRGQDPVVAVRPLGPSVVGALTSALGPNGHGGSGLATDKGAEAGHILAVPFSIMPMNSGKDFKARVTDVAQPLMAGGPVSGAQGGDFIACGGNNQAGAIDVATTTRTACKSPHGRLDFDTETFLADGWRVRRLTVTECERLQAFPDGYTDPQDGGKPMADGPRYNVLGDTMCTLVMRHIGEALDAAELA